MDNATNRRVSANLALTLDGRYNGAGGPGDLGAIVPYAATRMKFACHPNHTCRWLPMIGATIGAMPSSTPISESILAACSPL